MFFHVFGVKDPFLRVGYREEGTRAPKYGSNEPNLKFLGQAVWPVGLFKDLGDIAT